MGDSTGECSEGIKILRILFPWDIKHDEGLERKASSPDYCPTHWSIYTPFKTSLMIFHAFHT
jgi:hypothetical protein